jgi:HEAT repeat protein
MGLREEVADLIAELDSPRGEDALCALTSSREALPFVAEAYHREPDAKRRQSVIHCLWQYRDVAVLPTLRMALRDADERVWKEALDGFVALGGGAVQRALEEERGALSQDAKAKVKREWIDEAIEQIQSSADPG